ncbi:glycine betaine ABC transporter substrate-binding protein [Trichloromonas sp.]|uniref:glycine betaine ABC transporter substrate-binding protein n=1 Tax=Trichloromonas sp. TaxID=3069249 RepID=UPI003D818A52
MALLQRIKRWLGALAVVLLATALAVPAGACVGKTLVIGAKGTLQQELLAEMISILIAERTGTTIKVVKYETTAEVHDALMKADLDMYVEYTGVGQLEVLKGEAVSDPAAQYQAVKDVYNQDLNLVWLEPLGFDEPRVVAAGVPAQAAPVVRKDTLKKFPALARLINKLGGAISGETMLNLEAQAAKDGPRDAARKFLKDGRFI